MPRSANTGQALDMTSASRTNRIAEREQQAEQQETWNTMPRDVAPAADEALPDARRRSRCAVDAMVDIGGS